MSVVLHVGLPKTGTTYLQRLLADNRDRLRDVHVLYPHVRSGAMFEAAVEIRGSAAKFGLDPAAIAGTWERLCDRAREHEGTTVISHEVLGGATEEQIDAALAPLEGLDVHVVVTARDLGRQATAHWQEEVKLGDTRSFTEFELQQFHADTGRDAGPDAGGVRPHFWHAQDFADALRRWGRELPSDHVHLVVCPAPGASPEELWRRFAAALGVPSDVLDPGAIELVNPSLGAPEIALVREVNAVLDADGRLGRAERNRLVKREWAEQELAARDSRRPRTPAALAEVFGKATRVWLDDVAAAGYRVHGDPADLTPVVGAPDDPHPDQLPPSGEDPATIAARLSGPGRARARRFRLLRRRHP